MRILMKLLLKLQDGLGKRKVRRMASWATWALAMRNGAVERDQWMAEWELQQAEYWQRVRGEIPKVVSI